MINKKEMPNFFIVGAQKCGTTSLYSWLRCHPEVFMPNWKEPHYFSSIDLTTNPRYANTLKVVSDLGEYKKLFANANSCSAVGEASPSYLWDSEAPGKISMILPHAKIIILLRDPVERAYSEYQMLVTAGLETRSFSQAVEEESKRSSVEWGSGPMYLELSKYGHQVQRYLQSFDLNQIHFISQKNLDENPLEVMRRLSKFLDIDGEYWSTINFSEYKKNTGGMPKNRFSRWALSSSGLRRVGRIFVRKELRDFVAKKLFIKPGSKETLDKKAIKIIWDTCESEIRRLEEITNINWESLWKTFPKPS